MKKIVVIDDEPRFAEALRSFLEQNGYAVCLAHDGLAGFSLVLKEAPSLVLSDVLLPRLNGLNLCKKIKEEPALDGVPVILMTAVYKKAQYKLDAKQYGADDYLIKPFEFSDLLSRVEQLLGPSEAAVKDSAVLEDQLSDLRVAYLSDLPKKIAQADEFLRMPLGQWDAQSCAAFHRLIHGLTGSGAIFGFAGVSETARNMEFVLQTYVDARSTPDAVGLVLLRSLLTELKAAVEKAGSPAEPS